MRGAGQMWTAAGITAGLAAGVLWDLMGAESLLVDDYARSVFVGLLVALARAIALRGILSPWRQLAWLGVTFVGMAVAVALIFLAAAVFVLTADYAEFFNPVLVLGAASGGFAGGLVVGTLQRLVIPSGATDSGEWIAWSAVSGAPGVGLLVSLSVVLPIEDRQNAFAVALPVAVSVYSVLTGKVLSARLSPFG